MSNSGTVETYRATKTAGYDTGARAICTDLADGRVAVTHGDGADIIIPRDSFEALYTVDELTDDMAVDVVQEVVAAMADADPVDILVHALHELNLIYSTGPASPKLRAEVQAFIAECLAIVAD